MNCSEVEELIDALVDGELPVSETRLMMDHVDQCAGCGQAIEERRKLSANIKALPRHAPPAALAERITASLAENSESAAGERTTPKSGTGRFRRFAAYGLAAAFGALVVYLLLFQGLSRDFHDREIVSAHLRSLLGKEITQIASADQHILRPWFGGRLEFAPKVRSLASDGFPLLGARTDYLFERRVAAVVYARRNHRINLFIMPKEGLLPSARRSIMRDGFNIKDFTGAGYRYIAISDLNEDELGMFADLISKSNDHPAK